jgi:hypothetical protein
LAIFLPRIKEWILEIYSITLFFLPKIKYMSPPKGTKMVTNTQMSLLFPSNLLLTISIIAKIMNSQKGKHHFLPKNQTERRG